MNEHSIHTIDVHELKKRCDKQPDLCLIDVRETHEWEQQRIPGAIHIPKGELLNSISTKVPEKDHPIYLHCHGGTRSFYAAGELLAAGYHEVYSIDGGISEWAQAGYPVIR